MIVTNFLLSRDGKGLFQTQFSYVCWLSLHDISSPARVAELIAAEEARILKDLESPNERPGLHEQYNIQVEMLKDPKAVDAEFITAPHYYASPTGMSVVARFLGLSLGI